MSFLDTSPEIGGLRAEEEYILASFTRHLIEISSATSGRASATPPTTALNVVRVPAIMLDEDGVVADANAAAEAIFDGDVKIKDRRIFVRDAVARELLKAAIASLRTSPRLNALVTDPIIAQRQDKLPVILRIGPATAERTTVPAGRALL